MHTLFAFSWHELLFPAPSWGEKLLRPVLVYIILLVLFRIASKRELAQATLFDFLVVLLISNVVQNAMIGDDNSVLGATGGAIMLILLTGLLNRLTMRNRTLLHLLEGRPVLLIHDGKEDSEMLQRMAVSRGDLYLAIRKAGLTRLADVGFAILELDGSISIIKADGDPRPHDCLPYDIVGTESGENAAEPSGAL